MLGRIAAIGGAAGDVDHSAPANLSEVEHGEAAEFGRGRKVDAHGALPIRRPLLCGKVDRCRFEHTGIVDQHIDPPTEPLQRLVPKRLGGAPLVEIGADQVAAAARGMADGILASNS
jgi:hypothetical protein